MNQIFTKTKQHVIAGPAGKLELNINETTAGHQPAWGIVCHPHSLHGGTMENKVVTMLAKTFVQLGVNTIRFNFRGVGQSEGEFNYGMGELEDLLAVIAWLHQEKGQQALWLGGFSFGAYIVAKVATQMAVNQLVTIAPPVQDFSMEMLPPILCPWVLVQGELDNIVSPASVFAWAESRYPVPTILRFPQAGHFFHGQLLELRTRLEEVLTRSCR